MRQFFSLLLGSLLAGFLFPGSAESSVEPLNSTWPAVPDEQHPVIEIQPDGTIKDDGTNCVLVGPDATATVYLVAPPQLKNDYWDSQEYNPIRPGNTATEEGFDYTHHGLYLDLASINAMGRTEFDSERLETPLTRKRVIRSPGNEGKLICLTTLHKPGRSPYVRVQSLLETLGYHGMVVAFSGGIDKAAGNGLNNFKDGGAFSYLHAYSMLSVQLKAGRDLKQFFANRGFSPAQATCSAAAMQASAFPLIQRLLTPMGELSLAGRYATFWLSSFSGNTIDCIGQAVFQPIGEKLSPADGTIRQPGSKAVTDAWGGFGALGSAYALAGKSDGLHVMLVKITITSAGRTRSFIRNINEQYFWRDSQMLPLLQDGLVSVSMALVDTPGAVTNVFFDEYLKQMSSSATGYMLSSSQRIQEMEEWFQSQISKAALTMGVMAGGAVASPYVGQIINYLIPYGKAYIPGFAPATNLLGRVLSVPDQVKDAALSAGSIIGGKIRAVPGVEMLQSYLVYPELFASNSATKGIFLHVAVNYAGPASVLFTKKIADMMTDASAPRAPIRTLVQADQRLVIDHYVAGSTRAATDGLYKLPGR
ncbi:hypothetical protein [Endozoicomonas lisbonensis]|uniref:Uncharacterized protein n=1 Tax=Endozoicomonas lisbonensis TaxID=3120522 RepID=A0ABV2SDP1_9GAMM